MPTLGEQVREFARQQGADLYGIAPVEPYSDDYAELQRRMAEAAVTHVDFMIRPEDNTHFKRISDSRNTLPSARAVEPPNTTPQRGKIARTYVYYPAARQIGQAIAGFLQNRGYQAIHGQDVPLKYVAARIPSAATRPSPWPTRPATAPRPSLPCRTNSIRAALTCGPISSGRWTDYRVMLNHDRTVHVSLSGFASFPMAPRRVY